MPDEEFYVQGERATYLLIAEEGSGDIRVLTEGGDRIARILGGRKKRLGATKNVARFWINGYESGWLNGFENGKTTAQLRMQTALGLSK